MSKELVSQPIATEDSQNKPIDFKGTLRKNYLRVKQSGEPHKEMQMFSVELSYFRILKKLKALIIEFADPWEQTVFERNKKGDRTDCTSMWSFYTTNLKLNLICEFDKSTLIEFGFFKCPFEDKVRAILEKEIISYHIRECKPIDLAACFPIICQEHPTSVYKLNPNKI
jgi:hypothetical protein